MFKAKTQSIRISSSLKGILLISYLAYLIFLMVMPPFYVVDKTSGGRIHAPVGHHFFWKPPGNNEIDRRLGDEFPGEFSVEAEAGDTERFTVSVNKIRLAIFSIFGTGVYLMASFLLQRKYTHENESRYP